MAHYITGAGTTATARHPPMASGRPLNGCTAGTRQARREQVPFSGAAPFPGVQSGLHCGMSIRPEIASNRETDTPRSARPTVLLTLGRLPKALELARALHGQGVRVIIADPFSSHLCKPSRAVARSFAVPAPAHDRAGYLYALLNLVRAEDVSLVIPVSEEAPYTTLLADRLPAGARLYGPDHDALMALHDKARFIALANAAGLRAPETVRADTPEAVARAADSDYVVKPIHGCSGIGLRLRRRGDPLEPSDAVAENIVQRRIAGDEVSAQAVAHAGRVIGTTHYRGLVFAGSVACCFERIVQPAIDAWIAAFVKAQNYSGFIAFDFIVDSDGAPWPIECNPRLTSGVHFMDPDDLARAVLAPATADTIGVKPQRSFQEGHTTLTKVYAALSKPNEAARRFRAMISARDALWSARDPLPFLMMTPMSWPILSQTIFNARSFGEAATADLDWHAGPAAASLATYPDRLMEEGASA